MPDEDPPAGDVAGLLVGHDVPEPVAGEDEALVLPRPRDAGDLRVGDNPRLQISVTCGHGI